jgi:hypothetical protein
MSKRNCWEIKNCNLAATCPAAKEARMNGVHGGRNAGRACWAIPGTLCDRTVQGSFAVKLPLCLECPAYRLIREEEGAQLKNTRDMLGRLK